MVDSSFSRFDALLNVSRLPFFPEYTDHGKKHIEEVLSAAVFLMPEAARDVPTPLDAAVLCFSVLLHDLAMHINEDGFLNLVSGESGHRGVPRLDSVDWPSLWSDFVDEAARFSGRQNVALTGQPEPVSLKIDPNNWSDQQKLLVGEFLRRHHPTLAHQIALDGFPCATGEVPLRLVEGLDDYIYNIAGLVARSHGMPLRPCMDYLHDEYDEIVDPYGVRAVYLMALLRVADFIWNFSASGSSEDIDDTATS